MPHVQVRNVSTKIHRILKRRAAEAGMSLSEYLREELERVAETPTLEELVRRIRRRKLYALRESSADVLRRERAAR